MIVDRLLGSLMLVEQAKLHSLIAQNIGGGSQPAPAGSQGLPAAPVAGAPPAVGDGALNNDARLPEGLDGQNPLNRASTVPASRTLLGLRPVALAMIANQSGDADALSRAQNWSKPLFSDLVANLAKAGQVMPTAPGEEGAVVTDGKGNAAAETGATSTTDGAAASMPAATGEAAPDGLPDRANGTETGGADAGDTNAGQQTGKPTGSVGLSGGLATDGQGMDGMLSEAGGAPTEDPTTSLAMQQSGTLAGDGSRPDLARARAGSGPADAGRATDSTGATSTGDAGGLAPRDRKDGLALQLAIRGGSAEINRLDAARQVLDVALSGQLDLLAAAARSDGQSERAGVIDSFILNAAMIPGWPFPKPIELAGKRALIPEAFPNGLAPPNEGEALEYLAKMGANRSILSRIRDQLRKLTRRLKILMGLAVLMTGVTLALRALQEELESLETECMELERAAVRGWRTLVG